MRLFPDTHPEVERLQIELLRRAPIFRHLQIVNSLIKATRHLSWLGICELYPNENKCILIKRFICLLYGDESLRDELLDLIMKKNE